MGQRSFQVFRYNIYNLHLGRNNLQQGRKDRVAVLVFVLLCSPESFFPL